MILVRFTFCLHREELDHVGLEAQFQGTQRAVAVLGNVQIHILQILIILSPHKHDYIRVLFQRPGLT